MHTNNFSFPSGGYFCPKHKSRIYWSCRFWIIWQCLVQWLPHKLPYLTLLSDLYHPFILSIWKRDCFLFICERALLNIRYKNSDKSNATVHSIWPSSPFRTFSNVCFNFASSSCSSNSVNDFFLIPVIYDSTSSTPPSWCKTGFTKENPFCGWACCKREICGSGPKSIRSRNSHPGRNLLRLF